MIKIKVSEIVPIIQLYESKLKTLNSEQFSFKNAFLLASIIKELYGYLEIYDVQKNNLILEYGEKNESGQYIFLDTDKRSIKIQSDKIQVVSEKLNQLEQTLIEIDKNPLSIDNFARLGDTLTLSDLVILNPLLSE